MSDPTVRSDLRPGDLDAIVAQHERLYPAEQGVDGRFVDHVRHAVAQVAARGFPSAGEAVRIVELDGEHAGSMALSDEGEGLAMLRWVLLDPRLRGRGLGARLVGDLVVEAREHGYRLLALETFSDLRRAARIYLDLGFRVVAAETGPRWGRDSITYQRYELELQPRAHSRSSDSTGLSSRPFSVSA